MLKKILISVICLFLIVCAGCQKTDGDSGNESNDTVSTAKVESEAKPVFYTNTLTGEKNLSEEIANRQPVAIMINNISIAQAVQTGVNKADIVYETEVEGGITRLMGVFKDIESVGRVGTIRSARYVYVDLALGHGAVYLHNGQDGTYCAPHLKDIEHYTVDVGNAGKRISNGLAKEHTLYADGKDIYDVIMKGKTVTNNNNWQSFADSETTVKLTGGEATKITVPFSTSYVTGFNYDPAEGKYIRNFKGNVNRDYVTGEVTAVKNVFVLQTSISNYSDGKHRYIDLDGGDGYYFVNGTYTPIKWSKGSASSPFRFTNTDGTTLTVNQGNSWVCISGKTLSVGIQ